MGGQEAAGFPLGRRGLDFQEPATGVTMRPFLDSTEHLGDAATLKRRLDRDGYIFLRGLLPREDVLDVRRQGLEVAARSGWLDTSYPVEEAIANPAAATIDPEQPYLDVLGRMYHLEALHALQHHPNVIGLFERIFGEPVLPRPRLIPRCIFPQRPEFTTSPHQDYPYVQGTQEVYTMWTPLGDCPTEMGPLQVAERSHLDGVREFKITANAAAGLEVVDPLDGAWVSADFAAGDAVIFHSMTVHKGVPNLSNRLRQSVDFRFQRASEPITEASCQPFVTQLTWEQIYAGWSSDRLQYYWKKAGARHVAYDMVYFDQRDTQAFALAENGDQTAMWTLLRIQQNDRDPAKRERAAALIAKLDAAREAVSA
jgi:hypothetical protein